MTRHLPRREFLTSYRMGAATLEHLDEHSHSENSQKENKKLNKIIHLNLINKK